MAPYVAGAVNKKEVLEQGKVEKGVMSAGQVMGLIRDPSRS